MDVAALILIGVGWVLGILSHVVVNWLLCRVENRRFRKSLETELEELGFRLACAAFKLEMKFGDFDREFILWYSSKIKRYDGPNLFEEEHKQAEKLERLSNDDLARWRQLAHTEADSVSLKKYQLPFLSAQLQELSRSPASMRVGMLEILARLSMIHEETDLARSMYMLTFDSSLTPENHAIIRQNLDNAYRNIGKSEKSLSDLIDKVRLELR